MTDTDAPVLAAKPATSNDAAAFLRILHRPGDVCEVRIPKCPKFKGARKLVTASGYFNDLAEAGRYAKHFDSEFQPAGIYVTANPVLPDLLGRSKNKMTIEAEHTSKDEHVIARRWLFLDIDSKRPAGLSATDEEVNAAIALATEMRYELARDGWPEPIRCMSGNGAYLLYRIDLPNDDESTKLIQSVLQSLAHQFNTAAANVDCSTFNASRILKIPGTTARKGDSIETRPHRPACFVPPEQELLPVWIDLLRAMAAKAPATSQPKNGAAHLANGSKSGNVDRGAFGRCRNYVAKMPPAISGQGGHKATLAVACEAFRFGLDRGQATQIMAEFNSRCDPPWSDHELQHKLDDADKKVTAAGEWGKHLTTLTQAAVANGQQAKSSERPPSDEELAAISLPEPITANQLIGKFPELREPIIHKLARRGEVVNLIAAPKFGKSWLIYLLLLSIANGKHLFGTFWTVPGHVLLIDNELYPETLSSRLPLVATALGVDLAECGDRFHVVNLRGKLADLKRIRSYVAQFQPRQFQAIVIDAFYRTYPEGTDENNNADMTALYNTLDCIAAELDCVVIVVHHATKGNQSIKAITDVGSGAGAQSRAADTHLVLRPHQQQGVAVLEAAVRSFPPVTPICLKWEFPIWQLDTTNDPQALRSERQPNGKPATEKPSRFAVLIERILTALREQGPLTKNSIKRVLKCSGTTINEPIESLLDSGDIEPFDVPTSRGPQPGFRAVESDVGQPRTTPDSPPLSTVDGLLPFREQSSPVSGVGSDLSGVEVSGVGEF
jgi:hypothetical protein